MTREAPSFGSRSPEHPELADRGEEAPAEKRPVCAYPRFEMLEWTWPPEVTEEIHADDHLKQDRRYAELYKSWGHLVDGPPSRILSAPIDFTANPGLAVRLGCAGITRSEVTTFNTVALPKSTNVDTPTEGDERGVRSRGWSRLQYVTPHYLSRLWLVSSTGIGRSVSDCALRFASRRGDRSSHPALLRLRPVGAPHRVELRRATRFTDLSPHS